MIPREYFDKTWRYCETTAKRGYTSAHAARRAYTGTHRIRTYRCSYCNLYHVTTTQSDNARRIR
jgi:hypothetical protein